MQLVRDMANQFGVFGSLRSDDDVEVCKTLEHAYLSGDGVFRPKIPQGDFLCVRGIHKLAAGIPFETFEVVGVFGHSGLLFHAGNSNADSNGCILVGTEVDGQRLIHSRTAFMEVMNLLKGVQSFALTVV